MRRAYTNLPSEVRENIELLNDKSSGAFTISWHVDASHALQKLAASLDRARPLLDANKTRVVQAFPFSWHTKNARRYSSLRYSDETVHAVTRVLSSATLAYLSYLSGESVDKKGKDYRRLGKFTKSCVDTLVSFCLSADSMSWRHVVSYLRQVCKAVGVNLDEFLSSDLLGQNYNRLREGLAKAIEVAAGRGQPDELELLFAALPGHQLRDEMAGVLKNVLSERGAQLPFPMQEAIMSLLGMKREGIRPEYVNPAESSQVTRLAAFMLQLWDSAQTLPATAQLFEEFRVLCEAEFKLFLRGDVGMKTQFDPRLHEGEPPSTGKVRILRPWVEWFDPPRAFIVIRAVVEPAE